VCEFLSPERGGGADGLLPAVDQSWFQSRADLGLDITSCWSAPRATASRHSIRVHPACVGLEPPSSPRICAVSAMSPVWVMEGRIRREHFSSAALSITDDLLHRNILLLRATALNRLRDSGGCGLVLSAFPWEEIVGSERGACLEDRAVVDLIEPGAPMMRHA
jgi:hypothetical protein